ncbi:MarR family winged helix-turn-helix transcriptional regulator [Metallococcus carri]|uniref:MarR family winged helix-turn-helix transcriptional regulator n=1 Tax=Metallococcus carri TaxID=1656884 RepID=UPI002E2B3BA5|nr:MarR family transcriptional regulator [Metallococcus carri]
MTRSDDDLGIRFLSAVARLNRWVNKHADLPVPHAQARLLSLVEEFGTARIGELAAADHCSQPTMTTQVQRLEAAGLLRRTADDTDARASLVALTPAGAAALEDARRARAAVFGPVLDELDPADREAMSRMVALTDDLLRRGREARETD